ncbi:MAG: hypothetical protein R3E48_18530 [Burkholderiaceae bacterium]
MTPAERSQARRAAVDETVARVRAIEAEGGITRDSIERIRQAVQALAKRRELFLISDFPLPEPGAERNNALYRLSEDADHRFALYAQVSSGGTDTPVHDHTTWAVIAGIEGRELNRLFAHDGQGGIRQTGEFMVDSDAAIAFMPEDLHSIHIEADGPPVLNFHMYGLALEQLHGRRYFRPATHDWKHFPASSGIRDLPQA